MRTAWTDRMKGSYCYMLVYQNCKLPTSGTARMFWPGTNLRQRSGCTAVAPSSCAGTSATKHLRPAPFAAPAMAMGVVHGRPAWCRRNIARLSPCSPWRWCGSLLGPLTMSDESTSCIDVHTPQTPPRWRSVLRHGSSAPHVLRPLGCHHCPLGPLRVLRQSASSGRRSWAVPAVWRPVLAARQNERAAAHTPALR